MMRKSNHNFKFSFGRIFFVVSIGLLLYIVLPKLGRIEKTLLLVKSANLIFIFIALIGSFLNYAMAAFALRGIVKERLSYWAFLASNFAATFVSGIAPQAIGGVFFMERFLEKNKVKKATAITVLAINSFAGGFVHFVLAVIVLVFVTKTGIHLSSIIRKPPKWVLYLVLSLLVVLLVLFFVRLRKGLDFIKKSFESFKLLEKEPKRIGRLLLGCFGVTFFDIFALAFSLWAFKASIPLLQVAAVYLVGAAIGAASPTPGGLGAVEAALVAGLLAFGLPVEEAVPGVLIYRLLTFWLPILAGVFTFRSLKRQDLV